MVMTNIERFERVLRFEPADRLPAIEWAPWWDKTLNRWRSEGLPADLDYFFESKEYFGLDPLYQLWVPVRDEYCPIYDESGIAMIRNTSDYEALLPHLYTQKLLQSIEKNMKEFAETRIPKYACWFTLDGFFWFPRVLFGIEEHLYAFYDHSDLMKRINRNLCDYYKKVLEIIFHYLKPQFMTFAEDMSYNHGPMISRDLYNEFMLPYYLELVPMIKEHGTKVFIDTDGFVEPLIPWFKDAGIEGVLPLERMAGVDVNRIRENHPDLLMIGGFDKTIMHLGENAMRAEFERILPAMKSGGYIPSVDHQTPPDVSLKTYRIYVRLLKEYVKKAAE